MYKMLGTLLVAGGLIFAQTTPPGRAAGGNMKSGLSAADHRFVTDAAEGGMAEVQLGQLAVSKATNPDVKSFGQRMVDDHTKINDQLKSVATTEGIQLPTSIGAKNQATYDRLNRLSGAAFDRAYMQDMVRDHEADAKEFERVSQSGSNAGLKSFAGQALPTLQEHLRMAKDVEGKLGK
jgi:putative membrane protein